jgi:DNA-binding response OmpR family regulator
MNYLDDFPMYTQVSFAGKIILVVEDAPIIGVLIEDILLDEGCSVHGPHTAFDAAMRAARYDDIDLAILGVHLPGEMFFPIAEALAARNIPFVLISSYQDSARPADHPDWIVCNKPFEAKQLLTALSYAVLQKIRRDKIGQRTVKSCR